VVFPWSPPLSAEVLERVLAVVDGRPLTLTETQLFQLVRGVDQAAAVEAVIDERLMFQEATRLPQAAVSSDEEERAYSDLVARLPAAGVAGAEAPLRALVRRQVAILKYVEFRFRSQVRVDDAAVHDAYAAEYGSGPAAPSFESVAAKLREQLSNKDLDQRIEAWVRELRTTAEIRYN
jgi:hypothetical protein